MMFLICEPSVSIRSTGQADTCIDLIFSSTFDATASVFDESDVLAWPRVSVPTGEVQAWVTQNVTFIA